MRAALLILMMLLTAGCDRPPPDEPPLAVSGLLGGTAEGYARADAPRTFRFPADHGPHPDYRNEWWYFTGNLQAADGRRFGFQLTFFRNAVAPGSLEGESRWRSRQIYMAHFAVTDVASARFIAHERFARAALGLAGAKADPLQVWVEAWSAHGGPDTFPLELAAAAGDVALELTLDRGKPPVLQGDAGLSQKSAEAGNASYYYSMTRLPAAGTLRVDGETFAVDGLAWLDREWSSSALGPGQVGWDWFSLQLDHGWELMFYRLRRADGSTDRFSAGALIAPDGSKQTLAGDDVAIDVTRRWQSPRGGTYPAGWRLRVPEVNLSLAIEPLLADQELELAVRYWEGAVTVSGQHGGHPVGGHGYVELTGYAE